MYSNFNGRSNFDDRSHSEFDDPRESARGYRQPSNEFDERSVRGSKSPRDLDRGFGRPVVNDFDERPIRGQRTNTFEKQPVRGQRTNVFDEMPARGQRSNTFDEQPVRGQRSNEFDERPSRSSRSPRDNDRARPAVNEFDQRPARVSESPRDFDRGMERQRPSEFEERHLSDSARDVERRIRGQRTNEFDERPTRVSKSSKDFERGFDRPSVNEFDERPIKRERSKEVDEQPVRGVRSNESNERNSRSSRSPRDYDRGFDRLVYNKHDERPIRGQRSATNEFNERPERGHRSNGFDERPSRSSKSPRDRDRGLDRPTENEFDEQPVRSHRSIDTNERPSRSSKSPRDYDRDFDRPVINEFDERQKRGKRSNDPYDERPIKGQRTNDFEEMPVRGQRINEFDERPSRVSKSLRDKTVSNERPVRSQWSKETDERHLVDHRSNEFDERRPARVSKSPKDRDLREYDKPLANEFDEPRRARVSKSPRDFDRGINDRQRSNEFDEQRPARGSVRDLDRSRDTNVRSNNNNNLYTIHVTTSNIKLAGTDANVYVKLYGENMVSDKMPLTVSQTPGNMFEAGKVDIFKIKCEDVGALRKLRIGHDNKGLGSGWHLKEVLVESQVDAQTWLFKCNRWLDKNEEDGKIERELFPVDASSSQRARNSRSGEKRFDERLDSPVNPSSTSGGRSWEKSRLEDPFQTVASDQITYKLYVSTSELRGSGTDANVYVNIYGHKLNTGKIVLKSSRTNLNKFEAGKTDYFEITGTDVGEIEMLRIGHDNMGLGAAWHLREVVIETPDRGKFIFPCDQWLDRKHGDGKIERDLLPEQRQLSSRSPRAPSSDRFAFDNEPFDTVPSYNSEPLLIEYKVSVTTSDVKYAGTDANVYVNLFGRKLETGRILLKGSKTNINPFEEGKTDHFTIMGEDVGEIEMLRIGHDNKGLAAGWHLKDVVVETPDRRSYTFPCDQWLDKKEGDGKIERDLHRVEDMREMTEKRGRGFGSKDLIGRMLIYTITVSTSDVLNAGTDANVYIKIYGDARKSGMIGLDKSLSHRNKFEQGKEDRFEIEEEFFGDIYKLKIGHDNNGLGAGWHLNEVAISCNELNRKWLFTCNRWLAKDQDDGRIELELQPKVCEVYESNRTEYVVEVFTGDERRAGTDANVYLSLIGDKGDSTEKALVKSETHLNKFERNHMDRFVIHDRSYGDLYGIKLRHDNSGTMAEWFVDRVEITDKLRNKKYVFICQKWLSLHRGDKKIERIFKELDYKVSRQKRHLTDYEKKGDRKEVHTKCPPCSKEYYVKFYTGIKQALAGTDMNVYIRLFGDDGESKMSKLNFRVNKTHDRNFERNQIDLFVIKAEDDLGTLYAVELKLENCVKTANDLHIEKIQVCCDGYLYEFQYDKQVSLRDYDARYKQLILLEKNAQFL